MTIEKLTLEIAHPLAAAKQLEEKVNELIDTVNAFMAGSEANNGETQMHHEATGGAGQGAGQTES